MAILTGSQKSHSPDDPHERPKSVPQISPSILQPDVHIPLGHRRSVFRAWGSPICININHCSRNCVSRAGDCHAAADLLQNAARYSTREQHYCTGRHLGMWVG